MAKLSDFEAHICDLLSDLGPVRVRRMFGGSGLYADEDMFGLIAFDVLYFKVNKQTVATFEKAGSEPFTYEGKGKPIKMSYWRVPDEAFEDPDQFCDWARLGIAAARRAPKKSKGKRAGTTSR